jgi:putative zinc finger protein
MNCRRVEELIPLYAGGDIDRRLTGEVQAHLKKCGGCAQLTAEFEASNNWLAGATPELDEAVLADMKRGVMRGLQTVKPRPGWFELMSGTIAGILLRPAVAAALLLIVFGALTLWVLVGRKASTLPTEAKGPPDQLVAPEQLATEQDDGNSPNVKPKERRIGYDHHLRVVRFSNPQRRKPRAGGSEQVTTQTANLQHEPQSPSLRPVASGRMLRIEIQTGDPTIRIIWFAPEEVDSQQTNP